MPEKRKIIMDVDTGSDDAIALTLAMCSDEFEILGICSVNGNMEVKLTTNNTLRVVECCDKQNDIKVYKGADLPMVSTLSPWSMQKTGIRTWGIINNPRPNPRREGTRSSSTEIHPEYLPLPEPVIKEEEKSAVEFYLETLLEAEDNSITLIPVGPLTNVALAMRADPRICKKIKEIVIMGGGHIVNNATPGCEFNLWVDPESAEVVMQSGCKITWVPIDATHKAYITAEQGKKIQELGTKPAKLVGDLIVQRTIGYAFDDAEMAELKAAPIHDALAVCAVLHPEVLTDVLHCNVHVDVSGSYGYGETIIDRRIRVNEEEKNCYFALGADKEKFFDWMYNTLLNDKNKRFKNE